MKTEAQSPGDHQHGRDRFEHSRVVIPEATALWGKSAGVEGSHEDGDAVEDGSKRAEPEHEVADRPQRHYPESGVDDADQPDEASGRANRREDLLVSRFAVVQRHRSAAGKDAQHGNHDALSSQEVE